MHIPSIVSMRINPKCALLQAQFVWNQFVNLLLSTKQRRPTIYGYVVCLYWPPPFKPFLICLPKKPLDMCSEDRTKCKCSLGCRPLIVSPKAMQYWCFDPRLLERWIFKSPRNTKRVSDTILVGITENGKRFLFTRIKISLALYLNHFLTILTNWILFLSFYHYRMFITDRQTSDKLPMPNETR